MEVADALGETLGDFLFPPFLDFKVAAKGVLSSSEEELLFAALAAVALEAFD